MLSLPVTVSYDIIIAAFFLFLPLDDKLLEETMTISPLSSVLAECLGVSGCAIYVG